MAQVKAGERRVRIQKLDYLPAMTHAYNPSYSGGRDQEASTDKKLVRPHLN
jgi:hypothetical protein